MTDKLIIGIWSKYINVLIKIGTYFDRYENMPDTSIIDIILIKFIKFKKNNLLNSLKSINIVNF